jgi:hypothetical protein
MARPDAVFFHNSQFGASAIQVALTDASLAAARKIPPGMWLLRCRGKEARFLQGPTGIKIDATASAPVVTNVGTAGVTAYSYKVVAVFPGGDRDTLSDRTAASAAGATATGNAALSAVNYNHLVITAVAGAISYEIYRTVGGATQGKIGSTAALTYDDTGLAASGAAPATSTIVGVPLAPDGYFGPVYVDTAAMAYFDAKCADAGQTATLEFVECR